MKKKIFIWFGFGLKTKSYLSVSTQSVEMLKIKNGVFKSIFLKTSKKEQHVFILILLNSYYTMFFEI